MSNTQKISATALIFRDGKVLAVSRKDNPNDFGFPGGKSEENEMTTETSIRELIEETGLYPTSLSDKNIHLVYAGEDGHGYIAYTYLMDDVAGEKYKNKAWKNKWGHPKNIVEESKFCKYK